MSSTERQVVSTENHLKFLTLKPESWAKFNRAADYLFILNDKDNPENKAIVLEGDQKLGKSSLLNAVLYALGGARAENAINSIDNNEKLEFVFEHDANSKYIVRTTKTSFTLTKIDSTGQTSKVNAPKEALRRLIGPVGVSPMFLKEKTPAEQLVWIRGLMPTSDESIALEAQINALYKKAFDERTGINRDLKRDKAILLEVPGSQFEIVAKQVQETKKFVEWQDYYKISAEDRELKVSEAFDEANKVFNDCGKHDELIHGRDGYAQRLIKNNEKISDLKKQIEALESDNQLTTTSLQESTKFIADHADAEKNLEVAKENMRKVSNYKLGKSRFQEVEATYAKYKENSDRLINVQATLDDAADAKKKLIAAMTPDIEGLEVCVPGVVDTDAEREKYEAANPDADELSVKEYLLSLEDEKREGIYYQGHSVSELSESELWDLAIQLWQVQGVRVVLIENIPSLGSDAVLRINKFLEDGGQVLCSAMNRAIKDEIKISFLNKIV